MLTIISIPEQNRCPLRVNAGQEFPPASSFRRAAVVGTCAEYPRDPRELDFQTMSVRKKPELNQALSEAIREFGSPTTPHELERRGVHRVRSISMAQISAMIEKAVNRTILERTLGGAQGDLAQLVDHAQVGLLGLLKGVEEVEASRGAIHESRNELMSELEEMRRERTHSLVLEPVAPNDPTVLKMKAAIRASFEKLGVSTPQSSAIEQELEERALVLLEEARRRAAAAQIRVRDDHIEQLERRITKLVQSLEETEKILNRVAAMKNIDLGVASLFRVVQGLAQDEPNREMKRQLMETIFKANVEFQQKRAAAN